MPPRRFALPALTALAALAALALAGGVAAQEAAPVPERTPFAPDTVVALPDGLRVVVVHGPSPDVAALRLFVAFEESPDEAGVARVLRDMAQDRIVSLARPFGARVSVERTPRGLAYSAAGAVQDLETLAWLLREASSEPDVDGPSFLRARAALREEAARRVETPLGRIAADLRARVAPDVTPEAPAPAAVDALAGGTVLATWRRSHGSAAMTLVVAAPVALEVVLAAVQGLGLESPVQVDAPPPLPPARPPRVETLRAWYGEAWTVGTADDPTAAVAARLIARTLGAAQGAWETSVQLWELPDRTVIAVLGAAYPRAADAMRSTVSGAIAAAAGSVDPAAVHAVAATLRRDRLFAARTTTGLVETVGEALEGPDGIEGLEARLEALDRLNAADVRAFLEGLARSAAVQVEVRP